MRARGTLPWALFYGPAFSAAAFFVHKTLKLMRVSECVCVGLDYTSIVSRAGREEEIHIRLPASRMKRVRFVLVNDISTPKSGGPFTKKRLLLARAPNYRLCVCVWAISSVVFSYVEIFLWMKRWMGDKLPVANGCCWNAKKKVFWDDAGSMQARLLLSRKTAPLWLHTSRSGLRFLLLTQIGPLAEHVDGKVRQFYIMSKHSCDADGRRGSGIKKWKRPWPQAPGANWGGE